MNILGKDSPYSRQFWAAVGGVAGFFATGPVGAIAGATVGYFMGDPPPPPAPIALPSPSPLLHAGQEEIYRGVHIQYVPPVLNSDQGWSWFTTKPVANNSDAAWTLPMAIANARKYVDQLPVS